jgi:hypothetical protein
MLLPYVKLQHELLISQQHTPINEQDSKEQRQPEHHTGNGSEPHQALDQFVYVFCGVPVHKHRGCFLLLCRFAVEVLVVGFRVSAGVVDDAVPVIRG